MGNRSFLQVQELKKRFVHGRGQSKDELVVFEGVDFSVEKGEFVCLIGHSGCGKSTILNILAGLERASHGYAFMGGREITRPSLERGVIFQNHSLLPWKSALENVCFSVRAAHRDWSRAEVRAHSETFIEMVRLSHAKHRKPGQLSGGMRQRVGIARAFATEPALLLMDEPFGALDALTRGSIQDELLEICRVTHQTVFMITHDVDEAIYLSDRVLLMTQGPGATIAEAVPVNLPRPRDRAKIIEDPEYYTIRNHLVGFLTGQATAHKPRASHAPEPGERRVAEDAGGGVAEDEADDEAHAPALAGR